MKKYIIRTYAREDLERMLRDGSPFFTPEQVRAEIQRREEFSKQYDQKFQELSLAH